MFEEPNEKDERPVLCLRRSAAIATPAQLTNLLRDEKFERKGNAFGAFEVLAVACIHKAVLSGSATERAVLLVKPRHPSPPFVL